MGSRPPCCPVIGDGTTSEATAEEEEWEKVTAVASASETAIDEKEWEEAVHATSAHTTGSSKAGEEEEICELAVLGVVLLNLLERGLVIIRAFFLHISISSCGCFGSSFVCSSLCGGCLTGSFFRGLSIFAGIGFLEITIREE